MQGGYQNNLGGTHIQVTHFCHCGHGSFDKHNHSDILKHGRSHK